MQRDTFVVMSYKKREGLPEKFKRWEGLRYAERFVEYLLNRFSQEGDVVLDPFAGFGTTLIVAEELKRVPYGIEFLRDRCDFIRSRLATPSHVIHGDARKLAEYELPELDLIITGPPYGSRKTDVLPTASYTESGDYDEYLRDIGLIFGQAKEKMKKGGLAIIEASNFKNDEGEVTTLAWDIAREVSQLLKFKGEIVFCWEDGYAYSYDHSYCMVFANE